MFIEKLALKDFRNYESLDISFSPGINILWGDNAQGKTNILEAIYMSATSKSHRRARDTEMISFGREQSHIRCTVRREDISHRIDIHLRRGSAKGIAIDGRSIRRSGQLFGLLRAVCFSPEDLSMIKNGPAERRHFLDMEMCQLSPVYLHDLSTYNRIINQRNALLRQVYSEPSLKETLDVWDEQLILWGRKLIEERGKFTESLNEIVGEVHRRLTDNKENLKIVYQPSSSSEELEDKIKNSREKDIRTKSSNVGPHRDDLVFIEGGNDLRRFGSQGQQRTAALSLKLSEIEMVKKRTDQEPVLLLDDVMSELDSGRQAFLMESIGDIQTMISCTDAEEIVRERKEISCIYKVERGKIYLS